MRRDPCQDHDAIPTQPQITPEQPVIVSAHHDVVHVADKTRHDHERDVHDDEAHEPEHV